jgi:hypothetical protein
VEDGKAWGVKRVLTVHDPPRNTRLIDQTDHLAIHIVPFSLDVTCWKIGCFEKIGESWDYSCWWLPGWI